MSYSVLAAGYDPLTRDVNYEELADYLAGRLGGRGVPEGGLLLDLACGTGSLACALAERGYEVIGVDSSPDMLSVAQSKAYDVSDTQPRPVFIMQDMRSLDLYGTVAGAVCTLDGLNHILDEDGFDEVLRRLALFIEPGGCLVFDINTPCKLRGLDGHAFLDEAEREGIFCAWSVADTGEDGVYEFCIDVFTRRGKLWERRTESFCERAWEPDWIRGRLERHGFGDIEVFGDRSDAQPGADEQRIFFVARRM